MNRRRFLSLAAACLAAPATAAPLVWRGRALGADVSLRVVGLDRAAGARLWRRVGRELERIERTFSLYRASDLTRLNAAGQLASPGADLRRICALSTEVHAATDGAFDPSVQTIWQALAEGRDPAGAVTGWSGVEIGTDRIRLAPGMALTFNGIAQGFAADRVADLMRREGLGDVMIDMGELRGMGQKAPGQDWQAGIAGPDGALLATLPLRDRALATSSPAATRVGPGRAAHILHPDGRASRWNTVSVSAPNAALADALSTAFCLMSRAGIGRTLARFPGVRLEYLG